MRAMRSTAPKPPNAFPMNQRTDASFVNRSADWPASVAAPIGITVCSVVLVGTIRHFPECPALFEDVACGLEKQHLGSMDSISYADPLQVHFHLVAAKSTDGMRFIRDELERLGFLRSCKAIGWIDAANRDWRVFWSK